MIKRLLVHVCVAWVSVALFSARSVADPLYTVTSIGSTGPGVVDIYGFNNAGQIVGYDPAPGQSGGYGFVYDGSPGGTGAVTPIGAAATPDGILGLRLQPAAINDRGQIVGTPAQGSPAGSTSFLETGGQITPLPGFWPIAISDSGLILGQKGGPIPDSLEGVVYNTATGATQVLPSPTHALQTWPTAINNAGEAVGNAFITTNGSILSATLSHPLLFKDGTLIDLGTLGGSSGNATAINDRGEIVGWADTANNASGHAFLYRNGKMIDLGTLPGDASSNASGINSAGQIVGSSSPQSGPSRGFLYAGGVMKDLNQLLVPGSGWTVTIPFAINNLGQILAYGIGPGNGDEVLLTPSNLPAPTPPDYPSTTITPEPTSLALYALGGIVVAVRCRRRRSVAARRQGRCW